MSKLPRHQLAGILAQKSLGRVSAKKFGDEVAAYLLDEGRTGELDSLLRDIMQYRADHGIVEAIATSSHPLTGGARKDIEREVRSLYPGAKQVIISESIDPSIVGGVKIELANQQLDLSVRAKLNKFKQLANVGKD